MEPGYLALAVSGELAWRAERARKLLAACRLCPRRCGVDRLQDELGFCGAGARAGVASYHLHFGEEGPLVGETGSGTIFFSGCNLGCVFCQNADISQSRDGGVEAEPEELAGAMLDLARQGAANINLATPTHVVPQILEALCVAAEHGLRLPLVYNSSGYDDAQTLRLLDGVVDIYMPDVKIWEPDQAARLLSAEDYPQRARAAVLEMHRQVGDLQVAEDGLARRGLLVRHLVMPARLAGTESWVHFLAENVSLETCVHVMAQYRPCHRARDFADIARAITNDEFREALDAARRRGLRRLLGRGESLWRLITAGL
ncbi:MAG: putative pyruvate formate lyase activating enzyme [Desulfovibrionales bacterium]|nr:putative pyruvate formate lyase activating enzyme [Desulfovibrionales bacterium]